jgi:hypothetical protein
VSPAHYNFTTSFSYNLQQAPTYNKRLLQFTTSFYLQQASPTIYNKPLQIIGSEPGILALATGS